MAKYKFLQIDWKSSLVVVIPVLFFQTMQNNWGTGMAVLVTLGLGILLGLAADKYFTTVAEFQDSDVYLQRGYLGKAVKMPYTEIDKLTYSNATRFLKLTLVTKGNTLELPPPARLAQAEELFSWLRTKNPVIAFEIKKPAPVLELN